MSPFDSITSTRKAARQRRSSMARSEALAAAEREPVEVQAGLFLQTSNDVVAYLDFLDG